MDKQKVAALIITVFMGAVVFFCIRANGSNINDVGESINKVSDNIDRQESVKNDLNNKLNELNKYKDNLVEYMKQLNKTYSSVQKEISSLDDKIAKNEAEIKDIDEQLAKAVIDKDEQYESMKLRIRYLYESGDLDYIDAILSAGSVGEMLNKVEYIENIVEYDRNMMDSYREAIATIEVVKEELEKAKTELEYLKEEQLLKKEELEKLMADSANNIASKQNQIDVAEEDYKRHQLELESMYAELDYLSELESRFIAESISESIRLSEEESSRIAAGETETTTPYQSDYVPEEDDLAWMTTIIYCEANGQPDEGQLAVATVVMNRTDYYSKYGRMLFPNTVKGVISSPYQFSPYGNERWKMILNLINTDTYQGTIYENSINRCMKHARMVLIDGYRTGNYHFFRTYQLAIDTGKVEAHPEGVKIGDHFFY